MISCDCFLRNSNLPAFCIALSSVVCGPEQWLDNCTLPGFDDTQIQLLESGVRPHPGPVFNLSLVVQNISSFAAYSSVIFAREFDLMLCQETTLPARDWKSAYDEVHTRGHRAIFTGTDPELDCTAGVGVVFKPHIKIIQLDPVTKRMKDGQGNIRVQLLGVCLPHDVFLIIANVYGWTGGHQNKQARIRTDDLISVILAEFAQLPSGPRLFVGDLNAEHL